MGPLEAGRARVARAVEPFAVGTKAAVAVAVQVAVVAAAVLLVDGPRTRLAPRSAPPVMRGCES